MLVELSVIPLGQDIHLSDQVADVLKIVEASGLAYQLTPSGTCVEGGWDDVMALLKRCHHCVRKTSRRVIWMIKIDDKEGANDMMTRHVISVEEKAGQARAND
jgi:uncharacterized protein (TIGR00106 family)